MRVLCGTKNSKQNCQLFGSTAATTATRRETHSIWIKWTNKALIIIYVMTQSVFSINFGSIEISNVCVFIASSNRFMKEPCACEEEKNTIFSVWIEQPSETVMVQLWLKALKRLNFRVSSCSLFSTFDFWNCSEQILFSERSFYTKQDAKGPGPSWIKTASETSEVMGSCSEFGICPEKNQTPLQVVWN